MARTPTPKKLRYVVCVYDKEKPGKLVWLRGGSIDHVKNVIRRLKDQDIYYLGVQPPGDAMPMTFVVYHREKDELVCPKDQAFFRLAQAAVQIR